jgi:hypothetical protein
VGNRSGKAISISAQNLMRNWQKDSWLPCKNIEHRTMISTFMSKTERRIISYSEFKLGLFFITIIKIKLHGRLHFMKSVERRQDRKRHRHAIANGTLSSPRRTIDGGEGGETDGGGPQTLDNSKGLEHGSNDITIQLS